MHVHLRTEYTYETHGMESLFRIKGYYEQTFKIACNDMENVFKIDSVLQNMVLDKVDILKEIAVVDWL